MRSDIKDLTSTCDQLKRCLDDPHNLDFSDLATNGVSGEETRAMVVERRLDAITFTLRDRP